MNRFALHDTSSTCRSEFINRNNKLTPTATSLSPSSDSQLAALGQLADLSHITDVEPNPGPVFSHWNWAPNVRFHASQDAAPLPRVVSAPPPMVKPTELELTNSASEPRVVPPVAVTYADKTGNQWRQRRVAKKIAEAEREPK